MEVIAFISLKPYFKNKVCTVQHRLEFWTTYNLVLKIILLQPVIFLIFLFETATKEQVIDYNECVQIYGMDLKFTNMELRANDVFIFAPKWGGFRGTLIGNDSLKTW